jgi:YD repeat-containing protein
MHMTRMALIAFALAVPATAAAGWYTDTGYHIDVFVPDGVTVEGSGVPYGGSIPGTSIRFRWEMPGCWAPREFLGDAKKNFSTYYKKLEITSGPTCTTNQGVELCTVKGRGFQGSEERVFQATMGASGTYCGRLVTISGRPGELDAYASMLASMAAGAFGPEGSHPPPKPVVAATAVEVEPAPDEGDEELGYVEEVPEAPSTFDPAKAPDVGRKVAGPCAARRGWTEDAPFGQVTWTWDGDRQLAEVDVTKTASGGEILRRAEHAYDAQGRRIRTTTSGSDVATRVQTFTYDASGRLTRIDEPEAPPGYPSKVEVVYDAAGRKTTERSYLYPPDYIETRYEYDAAGRLVRMHDAEGDEHVYSYDAQGRLTRDGRTTITWSTDGRTESRFTAAAEWDYSGRAVRVTRLYDKYGNVLHERRTDSRTLFTTYDYGCWLD